MMRRVVLVVFLVVLLGVTVWVTLQGKIGVYRTFGWEDLLYSSWSHLKMVSLRWSSELWSEFRSGCS